jgi:hypothetical protein
VSAAERAARNILPTSSQERRQKSLRGSVKKKLRPLVRAAFFQAGARLRIDFGKLILNSVRMYVETHSLVAYLNIL